MSLHIFVWKLRTKEVPEFVGFGMSNVISLLIQCKLFFCSQCKGRMGERAKGESSQAQACMALLLSFGLFQPLRGSMTKQLRAAVATILVLGAVSMQAQTSTKTATRATAKSTKKKAPTESATEREIRELREQMQSQQAQIDALKQENAEKDAKLRETQQSAQGAEAAAATATAKAESVSSSVSANTEAVTALTSTVGDLKTTNVGLAQTISDTKKDINEAIESPMALRYKGLTITPVAFFALESVWRQRSVNSDINTPFNSTPFPNAGNYYVSEFNLSGRQSRIGALFQGDAKTVKFTGYVEADFLSGGTTSNDNQSNSYTLRQRQIWGQAALKNGFTVTGGQMWSLVTETKKGTDNRTENLPANIDAQYNVGFSWLRLPAIRFQQKFGITTVAASLENAQITGFNNGGPNGPTNYFYGGTGNNGGLYNNTTTYTNSVSPDVVVKAAFDPKIGHFEIGGAARFFRDRYYPNATATPASATGATNDTKVGGGFFANGRVNVTKYANVGLHFLGGDGVGRYGTAGLSDVTVHPDGTLEPLRAYQGLFSLELHPMPKVDIFGYYGGEYAQRTLYINAKGQQVGYAPLSQNNAGCFTEGLPASGGTSPAGSCSALTRYISEGTGGFTYRFYNSPKYGRFQYEVQYSYLKKTAWTGIGGAPTGNNNMVFTSMRYYIP
jgi:hypothetical protein